MKKKQHRTLNVEHRTWKGVVLAMLLATFFTPAFGQTNLLSNPGFEIGYSGQRMMDSINSWIPVTYPVWDWGRIRSAATTPTYAGTNAFQLDAYANYNKVMASPFVASAGVVYEIEGWMKTPTNAYFRPTNGFCYVKVDFYNSSGAMLGFFGEDSIVKFRANGPTNWTRFTTGPVLAPAGAVTGRAIFGYCPGGDDWGPIGDQTTSGFVYVDEMKSFTNTDHRSGVMSNYSFEVRTCDYLPLTNMPYWQGFGTDGGVVTNHHKTGEMSLQIWGVDSLAGQRWTATRSNKYAAGAWLFSTNYTTTNAWGQVILQFVDAATNVLVEYASAKFNSESTSNAWTYFEAIGVAPSGTVYGRTLVGIVGDDTGFGTSTIWVDDATQRVVSTEGTTAGLIHNGGFDDGPTGNAYELEPAGDLPYWSWLGGDNAGFIAQTYNTNGEQSLAITFTENAMAQTFAVVTGNSYIVEGYIYNPSSEDFAGSAYGTLSLEFFKGTNMASTVDSLHFTSASANDSWIKFSVTNRAPWLGDDVTGRVVCAIYGPTGSYSGALYFDGIRVDETHVPAANSQAGALWNPGFEYTSRGTFLEYLDNWEGAGELGSVQDTYSKSGNHALRINGMDNLAFQTWEATQGWRYATSAEAFTPAADRLAGAENLHAVVQLQFLDASSNLLKTYESPWFTTNIAAGAWSNLQAVGAAPSGSRYGRTLVGLFGDADGFAGSVWFDDATQTVVSTTGTVAGLLGNPGFDDGPTGNAYDLQEDEDLPFWEWLGGTNAGFVTDSYKYDNGQSLAITYPENMMAQSFVVSTGYTYAFEGYLYTPAAEKLEGSAYGVLIVEYYQDGALISSAESDHFTSSSPSNEWVRFSVSHRAPWAGNTVTCRVLCAIMGSSGGYDGAVYFDGLSVTGSYVGATNVQAGSVWNPGFEYTEPGTVLEGVDSWTALGDAGVISDDYSRSGDNSLRIYGPETLISQDWEATEGWKYASAAWAYTPVADRLAGDPELHAVVIMQFFDGTGTNMLISYESPWFTTGTVAGVWSNLEVIGVAPRGSVYGRTLVGLLGPSDGFGGSVYFDDVTQRVVSTSGTMSGLLHNPGFDDGPSGNAYDLQETNDLPYWQWTGGTNAGFVARDYKKNAEQAFVITYPLNNVAQDWTAEGGRAYKAEGYLFTPASAKFDTDGTSFGRIELSFFLDGDDEADVDSAAVSASFGADQSADTWVYFAVTGIAPYASAVTGRVTCTIACTGDPEEDEDLAGVIYFDQLTLTEIALTADVAVAIADLPDPARVGQELTYSISVTNKGPQTAGNVAIVSILPEGVSFDSCNVSAGSYDISDDTITCTMGNLASGATGGVVIVVIPEAAGTITNAVSATTSSTDPVNGDNRAEAATVVLAPNRPPEITLPGPHTLPVGATTSFVVSASDPDHDPGLTLENTQAPAGATFDGTNFTWTAGAAFSGTTNLLLFVADDGQGADNSVVSNSTVIIVPYDWDSDSQDDGWEWAMFGTLAWGPNDDVDEDGALNWQERIAGTHPNLAASVFKVLKVTSPNGSTNHQVKVATEPERKYTIYFADQNLSNGTPWSAFADTNFGVWIETRLTSTNYTFTDDEGAGTTGGAPASGRRVYRVRVEWP